MKEKFLCSLLLLPVALLAQVVPPDDEPTVPINDYTIPAMLLILAISFFVYKNFFIFKTEKK